MEQDTDKLITEQFKRLPESLQEAIWATDYASALQSLMQKHDLRVDMATLLENEVALILLGLAHPNELSQNLEEHLGLSPEKARQLTRDVDTEILAPVRETLKTLWSEEDASQNQPDTTQKETLPTNVLRAKLDRPVHTTPEKEHDGEPSTDDKSSYQEQDPYREPIE